MFCKHLLLKRHECVIYSDDCNDCRSIFIIGKAVCSQWFLAIRLPRSPIVTYTPRDYPTRSKSLLRAQALSRRLLIMTDANVSTYRHLFILFGTLFTFLHSLDSCRPYSRQRASSNGHSKNGMFKDECVMEPKIASLSICDIILLRLSAWKIWRCV